MYLLAFWVTQHMELAQHLYQLCKKWHLCLQHFHTPVQKWHSNQDLLPINTSDTPKFNRNTDMPIDVSDTPTFNRNTDMPSIWHLHCTDICYIVLFFIRMETQSFSLLHYPAQKHNQMHSSLPWGTCTDFHMLSYEHILKVLGKPLLFLEVLSKWVSTENYHPVSSCPMYAQ